MKRYIADCHFSHQALLTSMDHRPFETVEEMNEHMILRWNETVRRGDEVFILGDFSFAKANETAEILSRLNGTKHLIIGNHDYYLSDKHFPQDLFVWTERYREIHDNRRKVILCHYPVFCYPGQYRKSLKDGPYAYMLYGHVHNTRDERLVNRFISETRETSYMPMDGTEEEKILCNMINCFCMFSDYRPLTLEEWIEVDRARREKMNEQ
ncbi:MAG: metallophosphoesterase family protein [Lachnospiraceae bacterium]|nr:metallophosphoesterase family protein [Lachnospiraceae bacterium]